MATKTKKEPDQAAILVDEKSDAACRGFFDNRFRKQFVLQVQGKSQQDLLDYIADPDPNKQGVLTEALNRGIHPKDEPQLDDVERIHEGLSSATILLTYSVKGVPAVLDLDPASSYKPTDLPLRTEDDRRGELEKAKLRAQGDPAGFAE